MYNRKWLVVLTVALLIAGMLVGCAPTPAATPVPPTKPAATAVPATAVPPKLLTGTPILIAYHLAMSASPWAAQNHCNSAQMAGRELNDQGGINGRPVIINCLDDGGDPKQGVLIANKVIDNAQYLAVLGPWWSGVSLATLPIYAKADMPMVIHGTSPKIPEEIARGGYTNAVQAQPHDAIKGAAMVDVMKQQGLKTTAIVHNKTEWGQRLAEEMQKRAAVIGITITSFQGIDPETMDFAALLTKIKSENPDALVACVYNQKAPIAQQMKDLAMRQLYVVPEAHSQDYLDQAGEAAAGNLTYMGIAWEIPRAAAWAKKYELEYKIPGEQTGDAIAAYDESWILFQALQRAQAKNNLTRRGIADELWNTNYQGVQWPQVTFEKGTGKAQPGWEWFYLITKDLKFQYLGEWNSQQGFVPKQ